MIAIRNFTKLRRNPIILSALNWAGFCKDISVYSGLMEIMRVDMVQNMVCTLYGSEVSAT